MPIVITIDLSDRAFSALTRFAEVFAEVFKANLKLETSPSPETTIASTASTPAASTAAPTPAQTAQTQTYTLEQLSVAAAPLMDAGKINELYEIIQSFGVRSLQELPPEKYAEYAAKIRALGAKI